MHAIWNQMFEKRLTKGKVNPNSVQILRENNRPALKRVCWESYRL